MELEYKEGGEWKTVTSSTNLFNPTDDSETLWEPGHTEYVQLRIRNAGSLALKYQLTANVFGDENGGAEKEYTNKNNEKFKLSQHLVFNKIDGDAPIADRNDLWLNPAVEAAAMGKLNGLGTSGVLASNAQEVFTLAVYMPTTVGNEANQLTSAKAAEGEPTIYLGLTLKAIQAPFEEDSFGNGYDTNATGDPDHPDWGAVTTNKITAVVNPDGETKIANEKITVSVPAGADKESDTLVLTVNPTVVPGNITVEDSQAAQAYEITLEGLNPENTDPIAVSLYVGKGLSNVKLYHHNTLIDTAEYNAETGLITFTTTTFSPFTVVFDKALVVYDEQSLAAALLSAGAEITLGTDITAVAGLTVPEDGDIILNLDGKKLVGTNAGSFLTNYGTLTINDTEGGMIYTTDVSAQGRHAVQNYGILTINGGTYGSSASRGNAIRNFGTATINGGSFTACDNFTGDSNGDGKPDGFAYAIANGSASYPNAAMTIENATVFGYMNGVLASDGGKLIVKGGDYTLGTGEAGTSYRMAYTSGNGVVEIQGGTFIRNIKNANTFFGAGNAEGYEGIIVNDGVFEDKINGNIKVDGSGTTVINGGTFGGNITGKNVQDNRTAATVKFTKDELADFTGGQACNKAFALKGVSFVAGAFATSIDPAASEFSITVTELTGSEAGAFKMSFADGERYYKVELQGLNVDVDASSPNLYVKDATDGEQVGELSTGMVACYGYGSGVTVPGFDGKYFMLGGFEIQ